MMSGKITEKKTQCNVKIRCTYSALNKKEEIKSILGIQEIQFCNFIDCNHFDKKRIND